MIFTLAIISFICTALLFVVVFSTADDEIGTEIDHREEQ